jgi:hypothetical protein
VPAALPPGHIATLYSSKSREPIAVVVTPVGAAFAVKADFGMGIRPLTPAGFAAMAGSLEPVRDSRFLPAGIGVYVNPRQPRAVAIEGPASGVQAVIIDPVDAGGMGGSSGSSGGSGSGGKGGGASG